MSTSVLSGRKVREEVEISFEYQTEEIDERSDDANRMVKARLLLMVVVVV